MIKKRLDYIDIFKGVGIILMIMGHIDFGNMFSYFIHAFHMPMFFFASGYFFKSGSVQFIPYLKHRAKGLLKPYLVFGLLHYIIYFLFFRKYYNASLSALFWVNTNDTLAFCNAIWFLTALFFLEIIYYLLNELFSNVRNLTIVVVAIAMLGTVFKSCTGIILPWGLDASMVGLGFFHLARIMKGNKELKINLLAQLNIPQILCCGGITVILIFVNGYINMRTETYAIVPLFWMNACFAIFVGISISKKLEKYATNRIIRFIKYIGKNSITFLCLNQLYIWGLQNVTSILGTYFVVEKMIVLIGTMICLVLSDKLIRSTPLKRIIE